MRVPGGGTVAWFAASSLGEGSALAARVVERSAHALVDVRRSGVRVRGDELAQAAATAAARDLGLTADPTVLQRLDVVVETANPSDVGSFWQQVLGHAPSDEGDLRDPLRRDPDVLLRPSTEPRPERDRFHVDVVRPAAVVDEVKPGEPGGPYGVRHADVDGNEVDLVPGDALDGGEATADWQAVFSAIACYRVTTTAAQAALATVVAELADGVGFPMLVDLRPGLVVVDSGKDRWDADAHGLDLAFTDLAAAIQAAARELGATADPALPRFVQLFCDAADVDALRAFWRTALGYVDDRRAGLTDLHDPRRLGPALLFQPLDVDDVERRRQRNRIHLVLTVPADVARSRLATILDAGGRLLDGAEDRWHLADPEGNELVVAGSA